MRHKLSILLFLIASLNVFAISDEVESLKSQVEKFDRIDFQKHPKNSMKIYDVIQDQLYYLKNEQRQMKVKYLLLKNIKHIIQEEKVYVLDDKALKYFKLGSKQCHTHGKKQKCFNRKAFYLPVLDAIFIKKDLSEKEYIKSFFHESVHSYQYKFRWAFDMNNIIKFAKKNKEIDQSKLTKYLSFYYERQAHYYTLSTFYDNAWDKVAIWETGPKALLKLAILVPTLNIPTLIANRYMPSVDSNAITDMPVMWDTPSAFYPQELMYFSTKSPSWLKAVSGIDYKWHARLSKAIHKSYHGTEKYFNRKLFKLLDDRFYDDLFYHISQNSQIHLENIENFNSPITFWLQNDLELFVSREIKKIEIDEKTKQEIEKIQKQDYAKYTINKLKKLRELYMLGDEGSDPDLFIAPLLILQDQLDVRP